MRHNSLTYFILALLLSAATAAIAQEQSGLVKTLGRPGQPGQPLANVTLRVKGTFNALLSDAEGRFAIARPGLRTGDSIIFSSITKQGYELRDHKLIGRPLVYSPEVPIVVVMVSKAQLAADKKRIEDNAIRRADENYRQRLDSLDRQLAEARLTTDEYRRLLSALETQYDRYMSLIGNLADRYARTDYDQLDSLDSQINIAIESGELDRADSLIHTIFDPTTVVERNRRAKAEIAERMRIAQEALDKATRDREAIRRDSAYAANVALSYERLAEQYEAQGYTQQARHCREQAVSIRLELKGMSDLKFSSP